MALACSTGGDIVGEEEEGPFKGGTELMFGESGDVVYLMEAGKPKVRLMLGGSVVRSKVL